MADEDIKERLERVRKSLEARENGAENKPKLGFFNRIKKYIIPIAGTAIAAVGLLAGAFVYEYLTGRQDYTQRNILFRASNTIYIAGSSEKQTSDRPDKESVLEFYSGGGIESKVGTYLFKTTRQTKGDSEYYNMFDTQNRLISSATQKPERFQAGWIRFHGPMNFREEFARITSGSDSNKLKSDPNKSESSEYMVYKFAPKRSWYESDVDVVEYPFARGLRENEPGVIETKENGERNIRVMINRLAESRTTLGWFFGKDPYRAGTLLEDFASTPENQKLAGEFLNKVRKLDSPETTNKKMREKLAKEAREIESTMQRDTIYSTHEGGILKMLPQGGVTYLGENPGKFERIVNWLGFGRKNHFRLAISNHWDLWPGNYPVLNHFAIFNKYNNGGYTIKDRFGNLARVDIRDFPLFYGQDVVYSYYLDLNGDGKLDRKNELIGEILCSPTRDERVELKTLSRGKIPDADITFTINYSFMAPTADVSKGMEMFLLCRYVETLMPDQVHKGFGRHSLLGLINDAGSDAALFSRLNIKNESRALTQESTLAAKDDITNLLIAAQRPYAEILAQKYGIANEFAGQFVVSNKLKERFEVGNWPWLVVPPAALAAGIYLIKRRKENLATEKESRLSKLKQRLNEPGNGNDTAS